MINRAPLPKLICRKRPLLRHKRQMLVRGAVRIIIQALDMPVRAPERNVVEAADGEGGLGVGGCNEAFFYSSRG